MDMPPLIITEAVATKPEHCLRCGSIGITEPQIQPGQTYMLFSCGGRTTPCCLDCFKRLQEDIAEDQKEKSAGEEWKQQS